MMLYNKYKLQRNNGLLPKIQNRRQESIKTYCLIEQKKERDYNLQIHPGDSKKFIMFNEKEYLHRKCTWLTQEKDSSKIAKNCSKYYPQSTHTLAVFVANEPIQCNQVIFGIEGQQSLMKYAFQHVKSTKTSGSHICLSIMGIQNENSLTDQLDFNWPDEDQATLKSIAKCKSKIKVLKNKDSAEYDIEYITRKQLKNYDQLRGLIRRYMEDKSRFQDWVLRSQNTEYYLLGEIYHIEEFRQTQNGNIQILQSHIIVRINQYIRTTSPLMLRLGMILRKIQEQNFKYLEAQQGKLFKYLSRCFNKQSGHQPFKFHLFLQIGHYNMLKDEYLCLVPISQTTGKERIGQNIDSSFFYTKQVMDFPHLHQTITDILNRKKQNVLLPQISQMIRQRLKTKSYVCDTYSSHQKRNSKNVRLFTQQALPNRQMMDLQELVHETAKIYKLPSPKKMETPKAKKRHESFKKQISTKERPGFFKRNLNEQNVENVAEDCIEQVERQTNFQRQKNNSKAKNTLKDSQSNKFYEKTKQWLGFVYGKQSYKKLQQKKVKQLDETTSQMMKQILKKQFSDEEWYQSSPSKQEITQK